MSVRGSRESKISIPGALQVRRFETEDGFVGDMIYEHTMGIDPRGLIVDPKEEVPELNYLNDTWVFTGKGWKEVDTKKQPMPRASCAPAWWYSSTPVRDGGR